MPQKYQREIEEILQQAGDMGLADPPKLRPVFIKESKSAGAAT